MLDFKRSFEIRKHSEAGSENAQEDESHEHQVPEWLMEPGGESNAESESNETEQGGPFARGP